MCTWRTHGVGQEEDTRVQDAFASGVGKRDNGDGHHDVFAAEKINVAASAGRKGKNKYFPIHFVIHKIYFGGDFFC